MTGGLPPIVELRDLGPLGAALSEADGQAQAVRTLGAHPGLLFKHYRSELPVSETKRLDELVALPGRLPEAERDALFSCMSWPVARVRGDADLAIGCLIPMAPDKFKALMRTAVAGEREARFLEIDHLAKPSDSLVRRGLPTVSDTERLAVCRNIAEAAARLERMRLVYSDWSYSNVFWSITDQEVYLIDVDGCGHGSIPNIHQPNWDDPHTTGRDCADGHTDRYRVALMIARCLTGERDLPHVLWALKDRSREPGHEMITRVLLETLLTTVRERRPRLDVLSKVLDGNGYMTFNPPLRPMPPRPPQRKQATGTVSGTVLVTPVRQKPVPATPQVSTMKSVAQVLLPLLVVTIVILVFIASIVTAK